MSLIQNRRYFPTVQHKIGNVILMCGFGGAIWQTKRLITALNRLGYNVTALDFPRKVLSEGDPTLLPALVDEVVDFVEAERVKQGEDILLVGVSLGSLLSLNILRRSDSFTRAIMLTGGNIVTVAQNIFGHKVWPQSHAELSLLWEGVNIFTEPERLRNKRVLFVLPSKDKLIDTSEVLTEIERQSNAGNSVQLIERGVFGHAGTIVEETVLFPRRIEGYIKRIDSGS